MYLIVCVGNSTPKKSAITAKICTPNEASIEFSILLIKIIKELQKNESENLEVIKGFCPNLTPKADSTSLLFSTEQLEAIITCSNLKTMFQEKLRGCWRWDDYSLLQKFVHFIKSNVCIELLQQYQQRLDCAMKLQAIYEHCKQVNCKPPAGYAEMCAIIKNKSFLDITLEEYHKLKEFISQHCEIESCFIPPFTNASQSSLQLEWFIPLTVMMYMVKNATNNTDAFIKAGFVYMRISSHVILDKRKDVSVYIT